SVVRCSLGGHGLVVGGDGRRCCVVGHGLGGCCCAGCCVSGGLGGRGGAGSVVGRALRGARGRSSVGCCGGCIRRSLVGDSHPGGAVPPLRGVRSAGGVDPEVLGEPVSGG